MMRLVLILLLVCGTAQAESLVATRTVRAQSVLGPADLALIDAEIPGALSAPGEAVGQEARVTLYVNRPIRAVDIGPPALVDRNQIVSLAYISGALTILTEGRALARGGVGDVIRVMNITSRATVSGRIGSDGTVLLSPGY